jgi:predicted RNA polymerase sigma factor
VISTAAEPRERERARTARAERLTGVRRVVYLVYTEGSGPRSRHATRNA